MSLRKEVHGFTSVLDAEGNTNQGSRIVTAGGKNCECYLGLLFAMEDVAVYGYITPLKVKIVIALPLTDSVVRDAEITMVTIFSLEIIHSNLTQGYC